MLLVRFLDSHSDHAEALRFTLADDGAIADVTGDRTLVDFDWLPMDSNGRPVSRREPSRWARALARAYERGPFEVLVTEIGVRAPRRKWPWRVAMAAVVIAAGLGVGAWRAGAFKHLHSAFGGVLDSPRTALAHETAPPPAAADPQALPGSPATSTPLTALSVAADNAARELTGSGDQSYLSWEASLGLWGRRYTPPVIPPGWHAPAWWQSALALRALVRYLEYTKDTQAAYQTLIQETWQLNVSLPGTDASQQFANQFMDDTGWWGLAWLEAARYELGVRHDTAAATRYLSSAEWDAAYIYTHPRACGGIEWQVGAPADTISNAEFVSLAAGLSTLRQATGPLHDAARASSWRSDATKVLAWLRSSGLLVMPVGQVRDSLNAACQPVSQAMTYTQGEVADAFVQMGVATGNPSYYTQAAAFINYALEPNSGLIAQNGVIQERCEPQRGLCAGEPHSYDMTAYKGLLVDALADWAQATGAFTYNAFLQAQADAVVQNSASDGARTRTRCQTPHDCQLGFYWARQVSPSSSPMIATPGSQESGLSALTDALSVSGSSHAAAGG